MPIALNYIIQFVIGGGVIVGMSFLAEHYGGKYAAVLYAIPIQFTIAALFIYFNTGKSTIQELSLATIVSLVVIILFIGMFYMLSMKYNFWLSLVTAYILLICGLVLVVRHLVA